MEDVRMAVPKTAPISKRQPVPVDAELYLQLKEYSKLTGVPIARLVDSGLREYISTTLAARMETLTKYVAGDRMVTEADMAELAPSAAYSAADVATEGTVLDASPALAIAALPDWAKD
jgi:hypothetical protein